MDVKKLKYLQNSTGSDITEQKEQWVEENARKLQHLFEQWQKPLGINDLQYQNYLKDELRSYCDEPLLHSLIDSIT